MLQRDARVLGWIGIAVGLLGLLLLVWAMLTFDGSGRPNGDDLVGTMVVAAALAVGGFLFGTRALKKAARSPT